eukprot:TRINITY_DN34376_c0_g1_i1.p1 TRINITY_DN34376_c0_g1~~TRINITY_DN34376_c0_g1_i1.p1  ORF type:complete len:949 (-),score=200.78 TRINITY_DN34376_c0_g1_i1:14-2557(-)
MPLERLPDVLKHWEVPQSQLPLFWALVRKQFGWASTLPATIKLDDLKEVLLKGLRRVRDKFCHHRVEREQFIKHNRKHIAEEYDMGVSCGKGNFGTCTWLTHKVTQRRRVGKKIFKQDLDTPTEEVPEELNVMKDLDHPHILRVFEWFESEDSFTLVLEAARGGDLRHILSEHGHPGLEEAFVQSVTSQGLHALAYMHAHKILHRDLKPPNMFLAAEDLKDPFLLLADFGIAELYDAGTRSTVLRGTPAYIAPEVFNSQVCPASDLWSLGIVLYELLTSARPFKGGNVLAVYAEVKQAGQVSLPDLHEGVASEDAKALIGMLLEKDPTARPTAVEAQHHSWLSSAERARSSVAGSSLAMRQKVKRKMTGALHASLFSKATLSCIAAQLDSTEMERLAKLFESFDTDGSGELSSTELVNGLRKLGVDDDEVMHVADAIDVNGNGQVEYSEFIAGIWQAQGQLAEDVLYHAFHIFDLNKDGSLSEYELQNLLRSEGPLSAMLPDGTTVEQVLADIDTSHDGVISFSEFKAYLEKEQKACDSPSMRRWSAGSAGAASLELCAGHEAISDQDHASQTKASNPASPTSNGGLQHDSLEEFTASEPLAKLVLQLAAQLGRPGAEGASWARRLEEEHWFRTPSELCLLSESGWARLNLPLRLECELRGIVAQLGGATQDPTASSEHWHGTSAASASQPGTPKKYAASELGPAPGTAHQALPAAEGNMPLRRLPGSTGVLDTAGTLPPGFHWNPADNHAVVLVAPPCQQPESGDGLGQSRTTAHIRQGPKAYASSPPQSSRQGAWGMPQRLHGQPPPAASFQSAMTPQNRLALEQAAKVRSLAGATASQLRAVKR